MQRVTLSKRNCYWEETTIKKGQERNNKIDKKRQQKRTRRAIKRLGIKEIEDDDK